MKKISFTFVAIVLVLSACGTPATPEPTIPPTPTSTLTSTETPIPTATMPSTETLTPTPISTFVVSEMSNPALDTIDINVAVKGNLVEVLFYLKDVPPELTFERDGIAKNHQEYAWEFCVDTDNNLKTGAPSNPDIPAGSDYCLSASNFKSKDATEILPIEQGVQVNIWDLSGGSFRNVSGATIEVDVDGNTIKLTGEIPGITNTSRFYYRAYDENPGAKPETDSGQLFDRVFIE